VPTAVIDPISDASEPLFGS